MDKNVQIIAYSHSSEIENVVTSLIKEFPELQTKEESIYTAYESSWANFVNILAPIKDELLKTAQSEKLARLQLLWDELNEKHNILHGMKNEWARDAITNLLNTFPMLKDDVDKIDSFHEMPHLVFESILLPWMRKWIEGGQKRQLEKLALMLESMLTCVNNSKMSNVIEVSFLEPLVLGDADLIPKIQPYLEPNTLKSLNYWINRYFPQK